MNIKSGSLGHTLTAARFVSFVEFDWVPTIHSQAEARVDRIGQERDMMFYYLIGANTIDEYIVELLEQKRKVVNLVVEGKSKESLDIRNELIERMLHGRINIPGKETERDSGHKTDKQ
jgi:SNF2 family DNA or RNA helicase